MRIFLQRLQATGKSLQIIYAELKVKMGNK